LAAEVGKNPAREALTIANWVKFCFGSIPADDPDTSIVRLRRQFRLVKTVEGRNRLLTVEIQKRDNEGGDPPSSLRIRNPVPSLDSGVPNSDGVPPPVQSRLCAQAQRRNGTGFTDLPPDILNRISDFDGKGIVRAISRNTRDTLGYRNLHMIVTHGNVSKILLAISNQALTIVDNVSFTVRRFDGAMLETLSTLCMETSVLRLFVCGFQTHVGLQYRWVIGTQAWDVALKDFLEKTVEILAAAPHLRILDLDLTGTSTSDRVGEYLVELKKSKTLQKLRLAVMMRPDPVRRVPSGCNFPNRGAIPSPRIATDCHGLAWTALAFLATLNECRTLETVHINFVGHTTWKRKLDWAIVLSGLKDLPLLRVLSLATNGLYEAGPAAIEALVDLRTCPLLETFEINFNQLIKPWDEYLIFMNPDFHGVLPREEIYSLGGLKDALHLSTLHLGLENNAINNPDVSYLVDVLLAAPALHTLHLNLAHNYISNTGAIKLARLADASNLKCLNLNLEGNRIGTTGAVPLLEMKDVFKLYINLKDNPYVSDDITIATYPTLLKFHGDWLPSKY
jgi:hypothetical protein